jgi:hypothetical protein
MLESYASATTIEEISSERFESVQLFGLI